MSKLRCYPPTGGHYGLFIGKDHYEVIVEDELMAEMERDAG